MEHTSRTLSHTVSDTVVYQGWYLLLTLRMARGKEVEIELLTMPPPVSVISQLKYDVSFHLKLFFL